MSLKVKFCHGIDTITVSGLWQWDLGQELIIEGLNLPVVCSVDFSFTDHVGSAVPYDAVSADGITRCSIPDSFLNDESKTSNYKFYAFVRVFDESSVETIKKIIFLVNARPKPDGQDEPVDPTIFDRAIREVSRLANEAKDVLEEIHEEIEEGKIYSKPEDGIPESDLSEEVQEKLNSGGGTGEVESVNGKKGKVILTAKDVNALPDDTPIPVPYDDTEIKEELKEQKESLSALEQLMPEVNPTVGKVLKVLSVNEDGTFVCEWAEESGGGSVEDVLVNNTSVVTDGVANIPIPQYNTVGTYTLMRLSNKSGIFCSDNAGTLTLRDIKEISHIKGRKTLANANNSGAITVYSADQMVKHALCDTGTGTGDEFGKPLIYTAEEQASARERLGATSFENIELIADVTIDEETNQISIEKDINGNDFDLKEVYISMDLIGGSDVTATSGFYVYTNSLNSGDQNFNLNNQLRATRTTYIIGMKFVQLYFDGDRGLLFRIPLHTNYMVNMNQRVIVVDKLIYKIYLKSDKLFGASSNVKVYGVRR